MSEFTMKKELLEHIKPFKVKKKSGVVEYVIQLPDGLFLHWIESTNNRPVRISKPEMSMQSWPFIEQAQGICDFLKELWDEDRVKSGRSINMDDRAVSVSIETEE